MTPREWVFEGEAMHYELEHVAVYCRDINERLSSMRSFLEVSPRRYEGAQRVMAFAL